MYLISGILGSIIGAVGTVIGGLLAMLIGKRAQEPRPFLAFAGGMMVAVVFFDMLLESEELGGMMRMVIGAAAGGVFFALAEPLFSHSEQPSLYSTGILVLIGIAMHNLPEGLAVGSSLVESRDLAISLSLLMLVHNIPEGVAVCLPLRLSGMKVKRVLVLAVLTGLPTAVGAVIGTAIGSISREMISLCISFAGGAMLYISLKELIPAAGKHKVFWSLVGLCIGFFMTMLI
jgi:ZIP family zinc transporter